MIAQIILNGIIAGSIYALIALGFVVIYNTVRFFHFAHGIVYTVGPYIAYSLFISLKLNLIFSFFISIITAAFLGVVINKSVYYPLRKKKASNMIFLLASFGIYIFLQNLIALIYGNQILTLRIEPIIKRYHILNAVITPFQILILVVSIILMMFVNFFIKNTKLGKSLRAVSDDPIGASVVGINPERTILLCFAIGSALAGAAGILVSLETNIEPTMGFSAILKGIIASIVGGIGSIPGAMLGGFFIGIAENLGIAWIPSGWKDAISFAILIIFLLARPQGILGRKEHREVV